MEEPIVLDMSSISGGAETRKRKISCRRELLILSLQRFYSTRPDLKTLIPILQGEGDISLRLIDWFVTNYAKKHHVSYLLAGQEFVVYLHYKSQLKAFSKKLFEIYNHLAYVIKNAGSQSDHFKRLSL